MIGADAMWNCSERPLTALKPRAAAATTRITNSAAPGTPVANVQKRRLKGPVITVQTLKHGMKP